jgi:hypothetical protein
MAMWKKVAIVVVAWIGSVLVYVEFLKRDEDQPCLLRDHGDGMYKSGRKHDKNCVSGLQDEEWSSPLLLCVLHLRRAGRLDTTLIVCVRSAEVHARKAGGLFGAVAF